ncbi:hypothetical protein Fcan01_01368 [Folsomia candida]|uniref:Uncharacterized protein n=1 Tax=Folsomia candida TaxID=158441 RepID=A0A226F329_FOLCA|nr:hypothetical protein Fcan01_01368 [Folsomia candida]
MVLAYYGFLSVLSVLLLGNVNLSDQVSTYQEGVKTAAAPGSKVTITVGEQNGFAYTVNGETVSPYRIAVSGNYYNDEVYPGRGFVDLFLVVDTGIYGYYRWDIPPPPNDNVLQIRIWNRFNAEFIFRVICPYPVYADQLRHGQYNSTAVLINGLSRSQVR